MKKYKLPIRKPDRKYHFNILRNISIWQESDHWVALLYLKGERIVYAVKGIFDEKKHNLELYFAFYTSIYNQLKLNKK